MTNKCDSSSGNPTFVVYYWGGANNTLRQLLWEALVVQFVCCDVWPQPYSSFAFMRGPSHTVRLPLWGPQPNSLFAVMWVFFGGGALQFAQIMLGLNVPSFQTHPYPSTPSPFFFQFSLSFFLQFLLSFLAGCLFGAFMQKCQFYQNRVIKASFFEKYAALTVNFWEILCHVTVVFQKQNRKKNDPIISTS